MPTPAAQQQSPDFDWSKAVPVSAPSPAATGAPVSTQGPADTDFDWSRAKSPTSSAPIAQPTTESAPDPSAWNRFTTAFEKNVGIAPPQNGTEAIVYHATGGTGAGLVAYRAAKGLVDYVENAVKAKKPEEFEQAKQDIQRAVTEFHSGDYRNLASSAGSVTGDVISGAGGPIARQVGNRVRSISEGARPGGDLATPLGQTAADAANLAIAHTVGGIGSAGAAPEETAAAAENPIEAKTTSVVKKAGLPEGKAATSDVDVKQDILKQNLDAAAQQAAEGKQIQANLQKGIRDYWTNVASDNGVQPPDPNLSIREAGQKVGDNIIKQAKQIIKPLDDATGGKFSANDAELQSVNKKLQRVTSIDDEDQLLSEKQRLLWAQDDLLQQAADAGVPKDTLDTFKAKYRAGQAVYDQNNHIRMTTTGLPPGLSGAAADPEVVKSSNLLNRLVKDYTPEEGGKPGRLVQAGGEENAHQLLNSVSGAKVAENNLASSIIDKNPDFSTLPATDSKALREIVRPHVSAGKMFGTNADYKGILDDFDKMSPAELKARFSNPAAVRQSLVKAQARQSAMNVAGAIAGAGAATGLAGRIGWDLSH